MQGIIPQWTTGLFTPKNRAIGPIVAQVTVSEQERDELTITEHPVEQGAPINDHAFKRPSEVTIRAGWSMAQAGDLSANGNGVYGLLLSLQKSFLPFTLTTGKRDYQDMLIAALTVTTDQHSNFALMAEIVCRQVIIVKTKTTQASINSSPGNMTDPSGNATGQDNGDQQPSDVGNGGKYNNGLGGDIIATQAPFFDFSESPTTPTGTQVEAAVGNNVTDASAADKGLAAP